MYIMSLVFAANWLVVALSLTVVTIDCIQELSWSTNFTANFHLDTKQQRLSNQEEGTVIALYRSNV